MSVQKSLLEAPLVPGEGQDVFSCFEEERAETLSGLSVQGEHVDTERVNSADLVSDLERFS